VRFRAGLDSVRAARQMPELTLDERTVVFDKCAYYPLTQSRPSKPLVFRAVSRNYGLQSVHDWATFATR
jgi:hypothetical protein